MKLVWILTALIAATALAGCTNPPPAETQGNPTGVSVTRAPENAAANSKVNICWSVQGTGTIGHTAIHTDTQSHSSATSFDEYRGATFYPNNASAASSVAIPGQFCTDVQVGTQTLYYRAHAMGATQPGVLSPEGRVTIRGDANVGALAVTLRSGYNTTAPAGSTVTVCWDVTGQGSIPHTAIHTDNVSRPASVSFGDYKGQAFYPNNTTAAQPPYPIPGTFCTGLRMPTNGTLYFRAHAMTSPPGVLSTEGNIRVNGSQQQQGIVTTVGWQPVPPTSAPRGQNLTVCWNVRGTGTIPHTAIHSDSESHALSTSFGDYDGAAFYPDNTTAANSTGYTISPTGTTFCTNVKMPATLGDILYLRPHAMDAVTGAPGRLGNPEAAITAS